MDEIDIAQNVKVANESMRRCGYSANPRCEKCKGMGVVHPLDSEGKPIYAETVMCDAPGCLKDSFAKRGL